MDDGRWTIDDGCPEVDDGWLNDGMVEWWNNDNRLKNPDRDWQD